MKSDKIPEIKSNEKQKESYVIRVSSRRERERACSGEICTSFTNYKLQLCSTAVLITLLHSSAEIISLLHSTAVIIRVIERLLLSRARIIFWSKFNLTDICFSRSASFMYTGDCEAYEGFCLITLACGQKSDPLKVSLVFARCELLLRE